VTRIYVVDLEPLHVWAELSVPPCVVAEQAEVGFRWEAFDLTPRDGNSRALTHAELVALPGGCGALHRWRAGDDGRRDERYESRRIEQMRERVQRAALTGCELALELIVSGLPDDDVEEFENAHDCDRCSAE
jgi:hypothetical protein